VGFIADQAPFWDNIYYWSDFLHHETPWFTGAERIAQKLDMDVYYLDVRRIKRGYYTAEYKLITDKPKDQEQFWITEQYSKLLEATIQRGPAYWLWSHRRWKHTKEEWLRRTNGGIKPKN
jgi:KDO2-lipid IV(A) lauroyltransferase